MYTLCRDEFTYAEIPTGMILAAVRYMTYKAYTVVADTRSHLLKFL